jgi:hypothetical protein
MCPVVIMSFEHTIMGSCSYTFTDAQLNIWLIISNSGTTLCRHERWS